jgi:hypothetical protein
MGIPCGCGEAFMPTFPELAIIHEYVILTNITTSRI